MWLVKSVRVSNCSAGGRRWNGPATTTRPPALDVDERAELDRLGVENTELRMDREFLKNRLYELERGCVAFMLIGAGGSPQCG